MSINTLKNTYVSFKKKTKMITSDSSLLLEENRTFKKDKKKDNNKYVCVCSHSFSVFGPKNSNSMTRQFYLANSIS